MTAVPCASCTDEARCDRAGLCQTFARQQLQREEKTETVTWRPATATNLPDADETVLIACDTQFHSEPVWLGFHDGKGWREAGGEPAFVTHWARMLAGPAGAAAIPSRFKFVNAPTALQDALLAYQRRPCDAEAEALIGAVLAAAGVDVPASLSDERILHLWDTHVAYETGGSTKQPPLDDKDKIAFARAVLACGVAAKENGNG